MTNYKQEFNKLIHFWLLRKREVFHLNDTDWKHSDTSVEDGSSENGYRNVSTTAIHRIFGNFFLVDNFWKNSINYKNNHRLLPRFFDFGTPLSSLLSMAGNQSVWKTQECPEVEKIGGGRRYFSKNIDQKKPKFPKSRGGTGYPTLSGHSWKDRLPKHQIAILYITSRLSWDSYSEFFHLEIYSWNLTRVLCINNRLPIRDKNVPRKDKGVLENKKIQNDSCAHQDSYERLSKQDNK